MSGPFTNSVPFKPAEDEELVDRAPVGKFGDVIRTDALHVSACLWRPFGKAGLTCFILPCPVMTF